MNTIEPSTGSRHFGPVAARVYVVGCEQGAVSIVGGHYIHEWVHDSRHVLAFPCH